MFPHAESGAVMFTRLISVLTLTVFALTVSACAGLGGRETVEARPNHVILVSIDGFRWDYLERGVTPTLSQLAAEGASGPMRPSFPTITFPNHYTLVTGKHPDHHGIVGNSFIDAELGRFSMQKTEPGWWSQAEPVWITAEKAGLTTATMFWPGSETDHDGVRPHYWRPYDKAVTGDQRVGQVLAWMDASPQPRFSTLYFDIVDTAGHEHGPDAAETNAAMVSVDASLARLVEGLKARGLYDDTVLLIAADHGMAATSPDRVMKLGDLVDPDAIEVIYSGAAVFLNPKPGREAEVERALVRRHPHGECWTKATIPARLVLGTNPRVPAIICAADTGWLFTSPGRDVTRPGGAHGYDNLAPEMRALFIAHGPGVARGRRLRDLDSVDVQPLIGRLLGVAVPAGDGRPEDTRAVAGH
jgi:predicted AlkP superfamily pyrophosphatase or phosphodiesterase